MAVILDLSLTPKEALYDLLTKSTTKLPQGSSLTDADLTISNLTAVTGRPDGNNTGILLTPVPTSTVVYGAAKTVYYTRKDIATLGLETAITDDLANWDEEHAAATVLSYLKAELSPTVVAGDIVVSAPVVEDDDTVHVDVTMVAEHYTLIGSLELVVTAPETRLNTSDIPATQDGFS